MKNLICLPLIVLLFACEGKNDTIIDYNQLIITVDTVMVDSRDEILYLQTQLNSATLSEDRKYLYNFNNDLNLLEIIDLDNLTFVESYPFEKEGPDGTGRFIMTSQMWDDEHILLNAFQQSALFHKSGKKTQNISLRYTDYEGEVPDVSQSLASPIMIKNHPDHFYGLYKDFAFRDLFLGKIDLEQKKFHKIMLPEFAQLKDYFVQLIGDNGFPEAFLSPNVYTEKVGNKLIISNSVASDLYIYDTDMDSLYFKAIPHHLFPDRKKGKYPQKLESMEEFQRVNRAFGEEINYRVPIWDEKNKVFYRMATYTIWKEVEGKMKSVGAEVFMAIMDENFNVLSEQNIDNLTKNPGRHFLKDGKIWFFENFDDEMGFIRLLFTS